MFKKENKIPSILICVLMSVAISFVFMCLFGAMVYFLDINRKLMPFLSTVSVGLGCFITSLFAGKKTKEKGYKTGGLIGIITFVIITVISFIIGKQSITLNTLFHFLIIVISSLIGGITGVNISNRKRII